MANTDGTDRVIVGSFARQYGTYDTNGSDRFLSCLSNPVPGFAPTPRGDLWRAFNVGQPVYQRGTPPAGTFPVLIPNCEGDPVKMYSLTTTNAISQVLWAYTIPNKTTVTIRVNVTAQLVAGNNSASFQLLHSAYNIGGGAVAFGPVVVLQQQKNPALLVWDATFTTAGSNVQLSVVGDVGTTIDWVAAVEAVSST